MSLSRKLRALGYPPVSGSVDAYGSLSSVEFRTLVVWLEYTKIRFYPVDRRAALKDISRADWSTTFAQYLTELECPRRFAADGLSTAEVRVVLDWLLSQAVGAEYSDHAGEFNSLSKMWFIGGGAGGATESSTDSSATGSGGVVSVGGDVAPILDCTSASVRPAFEEEVRSLASLFRLPFAPAEMASILRVVRMRVEQATITAAESRANVAGSTASATAASASATAASPAAASSATAAAAATSSTSKPTKSQRAARFAHTIESTPIPQTREEVFELLDRMDLGFPTTEDSLVDHAAQVLRLLFLHDLRTAQTLANELVMLAQEYTNDPKTNASLGKVGV